MTVLEESIIKPITKASFFLKIISIIIIVEGVLGFLFFTSITLYQAFNTDFLSGWEYGNYSGASLYTILIMFSLMHLGLIFSGILLTKNMKRGILVFILSAGLLMITSFLLHWELNWIGVVSGLFVLLLMLLFGKLFRKNKQLVN